MKFYTKLFIYFLMPFATLVNASSIGLSTKTEENIKRFNLRLEEADARSNAYQEAHKNAVGLNRSPETSLVIQNNPKPVSIYNPTSTVILKKGAVAYLHGQNLSVDVQNGGTGIVGTASTKRPVSMTQFITVGTGATLFNGAYNAAKKEALTPQFSPKQSFLQKIHEQSIQKLYNKVYPQ